MVVFAMAFTTITVAAMGWSPATVRATDKQQPTPGISATQQKAETERGAYEPTYIVKTLEATEPVLVVQPEETAPVEEVEPEPDKPAYVYYDVPLSDELQEWAQDLCEQYNFPYYDIIIALIERESSFRETVISTTNDYGYMQINQCNHEWLREELGITDFTDGKQNIHCGIYMLSDLYHKYEDIGLALMAYNCGENGAADLWEQGIYSTKYSRSIVQAATELAERTSGHDGG